MTVTIKRGPSGIPTEVATADDLTRTRFLGSVDYFEPLNTGGVADIDLVEIASLGGLNARVGASARFGISGIYSAAAAETWRLLLTFEADGAPEFPAFDTGDITEPTAALRYPYGFTPTLFEAPFEIVNGIFRLKAGNTSGFVAGLSGQMSLLVVD